MQANELAILIENKRTELLTIALKHGMNSDLTIKVSQQLDALINEYNKVKK